jgi:hypothetical protein
LKTITNESFIDPIKEDSYEIKPIIRGKWQGGISTITYTNTPTDDPLVPYNTIQETLSGGIHNILHWVDKNNPRGPIPENPSTDSQYAYWEYSVQKWLRENGYQTQ